MGGMGRDHADRCRCWSCRAGTGRILPAECVLRSVRELHRLGPRLAGGSIETLRSMAYRRLHRWTQTGSPGTGAGPYGRSGARCRRVSRSAGDTARPAGPVARDLPAHPAHTLQVAAMGRICGYRLRPVRHQWATRHGRIGPIVWREFWDAFGIARGPRDTSGDSFGDSYRRLGAHWLAWTTSGRRVTTRLTVSAGPTPATSDQGHGDAQSEEDARSDLKPRSGVLA
jgi:hypothetical protein